MAATWTFQMTVTNLKRRTVMITGARTEDGVDPPAVWTKTIEGTWDTRQKSTAEIIAEHADNFEAHWLAAKARATQIDSLLAVAASGLAAEMQSRETG